ncbi:MAG: hypothetical protein KJZ64_05780 [Sphingomonadaceae bacterium]|nr:hypothetical protein [Sphingomonadaceae bacterium]
MTPGPDTPDPAPATATVTHAVRKGVHEADERRWTCTPDTLEVTQHGQTQRIPYAKLAALRLRYEPGRYTTNRCMAEIVTNTGWRAEIDNQHWAGFAEFEDRSLTYRLTIEALLARLRAANPQATLETGQGKALWLGMGCLMVALVALFLTVLMIGGPVIAMVKLAVLAFFVPTMVRYVRANRRQVLPITADPPEGVLPRLA